MTQIHPTAIVSPKAELAEGVKIGAYSIIGEQVSIGKDTKIGPHVVIEGHTRLGERNRVSPFTSIGSPPQDISYRGEDTRVLIGNDNLIREYVTINRSTTKQEWQTVIGNQNYLMAYTHVAHDCILGNRIVMSNVATLGGHITVGDHAILGGLVAVHQFVRIGAYAFIGGKAGVDRDVPPFMKIAGERAKTYGVNRLGLLRCGLSPETIDGLKKAYKIIWRENIIMHEGIEQVKKEVKSTPELQMLLDFMTAPSKRHIMR
ncbi:MAG: acyl-ACP--UDP-N-acetylglucosamine O-acyltransferase [Desulfobacteraceae bacterium]|nr:MAG: acyl-ACP--UDP-N-acetylglucosamine O-acyltransferase [Desulfobacteraceae bacterium]